jgi:hypothetical protein
MRIERFLPIWYTVRDIPTTCAVDCRAFVRLGGESMKKAGLLLMIAVLALLLASCGVSPSAPSPTPSAVSETATPAPTPTPSPHRRLLPRPHQHPPHADADARTDSGTQRHRNLYVDSGPRRQASADRVHRKMGPGHRHQYIQFHRVERGNAQRQLPGHLASLLERFRKRRRI